MSVSIKNSTNSPLLEDGIFLGELEDVSQYESVTVNVETSSNPNVLTLQFSTDGNHFTDYGFDVTTNFIINVPVVSKYLRVKFLNDSDSNQTFLRLQSSYKFAVTTVQVNGSVTVEPGSAPLQVQEIVQSVKVNNSAPRPYEFIPTAFNLTSQIYQDGSIPTITPYGVWNFRNSTVGSKVNLWLYTTLKQTDFSYSSINSCYMVIENKSNSRHFPYIALYSLPDGYSDYQPWFKSRWVFESTVSVLNVDERVLLYFGNNPINVEPTIRHIELLPNLPQTVGTLNVGEQIMSIVLNTSSGEAVGDYDFDLTKFGVLWNSFEDGVSGIKQQGLMVQNDLSEFVVSNAPNPTNGLKAYRNLNVNSTSSNVQTGPTWLHSLIVSNDQNIHLFLKLYNSLTAVDENDTPVYTLRIHQNQNPLVINFPSPVFFDSGIWLRACTGVADNNATSPANNAMIVNLAYY
jgi:hypothetical protein